MSNLPETKTWHAQFTLHKQYVEPLNDFINWPLGFPDEPTFSCFEVEGTDNWLMEIFTSFEPDKEQAEVISNYLSELINQPIKALVFSGLKQKNWVTESQKLQAPIKAGRFFCYASHHDKKELMDNNSIPILMDAGQAFGTGEHETTFGCLLALDNLADKISPKNILDLGTGTGLLAIAAQKLWQVPTLATDNDPIAIEVSRDNLLKNNMIESTSQNKEGIALLVSEGFENAEFENYGTFDLIIANILANPLIKLAPDIKAHTANGGHVILSGILEEQAGDVIKAYENQELTLLSQKTYNDWVVLLFTLKK